MHIVAGDMSAFLAAAIVRVRAATDADVVVPSDAAAAITKQVHVRQFSMADFAVVGVGVPAQDGGGKRSGHRCSKRKGEKNEKIQKQEHLFDTGVLDRLATHGSMLSLTMRSSVASAVGRMRRFDPRAATHSLWSH